MKPIQKVRAITGALLLALTAIGASAQALHFNDPYSYFVQNAKYAVQGDFNGDGSLDIAVVSQDGYVQMLLGNGNGTFRLVPATTPIPYPTGAVAGDFNGDGKLDIAIASSSPSGITVLLGNGQGGFAKSVTTATSIQPYSIAAGDMNGDGRLDVVVGGSTVSDNYFQVYLGKGNGQFANPRPVSNSYGGAQQPVLMDVNHDGILDLCWLYPVSIEVQLGKGDGTFANPLNFSVTAPSSYALTDLNGDGIPDLAVSSGSNLIIGLGNGDGTFTSTGAPTSLPGVAGAMAAADVNRDGHQDLIVNAGGLTVLLGNGMGGFSSQKTFAEGGGGILVGDYNGDGNPDLALVGGFSYVYVTLGNGNGSFPAPLPATTPISPASMAVGDLTGDGIMDIAVLSSRVNSQQPGEFAILRGNGNGTFRTSSPTPIGSLPQTIAIADVTGDGIADLLVGEGATQHPGVYVLAGTGGGKFGPTAFYPTPAAPDVILAGDLNHDGIPDMIILNGASVTTMLGAGGATFLPPQSFPAGVAPRTLITGDFNGDGNLDVAVGDFGNNALLILFGNGDGTFGPPLTVATVQEIGAVVSADFNNDGIPDLAVTGPGVLVFIGNGNGTFQPPTTYSVDGGFSLVAADFNGDGNFDLAVESVFGTQIYFLTGNGAGQFNPAQAFATPYSIGFNTILYTADFNGDGKPDIAALGAPIPVILNTSH